MFKSSEKPRVIEPIEDVFDDATVPVAVKVVYIGIIVVAVIIGSVIVACCLL